MSTCDAVVVEVSNREAWVEVAGRAPACGSCPTRDGCEQGLLGLAAPPRRYRVDNAIGARVGDRVSLSVADGALWRASLASYVLPVLLVVAGAAGGEATGGDPWAVAGALAGAGVGLLLLRRDELRARHGEGTFSLSIHTTEIRIKERP